MNPWRRTILLLVCVTGLQSCQNGSLEATKSPTESVSVAKTETPVDEPSPSPSPGKSETPDDKPSPMATDPQNLPSQIECVNPPNFNFSDMTLAFLADWDGDEEVYTIQADGSALIQFTKNDTDDDGPQWSPDGLRVGYVKDIIRNPRLYVSQKPGSDGVSVAPDLEVASDLVWSPTGRWLVVRSDNNLNSVDLTTGETLNLTDDAGFAPGLPSFSPNGERMVFEVIMAEGTPQRRMFIVMEDGSELKELSFPDGDIYRPLWNPVRDEILFEAVVSGEGVGLHVMSIDGTATKLPLEPKYRAPEAVWSPDGTMIGYIVRFDEINPDLSRHTLHIATVDGSVDVVVLKPPEQPEEEFIISEFLWAPDNRYITYTVPSESGGSFEVDLYILDICTGDSKLVVEAINAFSSPSWRPMP